MTNEEKNILKEQNGITWDVPYLGYKIWYSDGSSYSSKNYTWDEMPDVGVQFLVIYTSDAKMMLQFMDFYYKDGDKFGQSFDDSRLCTGSIKYGQWITDDEFNSLMNIASKSRL